MVPMGGPATCNLQLADGTPPVGCGGGMWCWYVVVVCGGMQSLVYILFFERVPNHTAVSYTRKSLHSAAMTEKCTQLSSE